MEKKYEIEIDYKNKDNETHYTDDYDFSGDYLNIYIEEHITIFVNLRQTNDVTIVNLKEDN